HNMPSCDNCPKPDGIAPDNWLSSTNKNSKLLRLLSVAGNWPLKRLNDTSSRTNADRLPNADGKVPSSALFHTSSCCSLLSCSMACGKVPVRLLKLRLRLCSSVS